MNTVKVDVPSMAIEEDKENQFPRDLGMDCKQADGQETRRREAEELQQAQHARDMEEQRLREEEQCRVVEAEEQRRHEMEREQEKLHLEAESEAAARAAEEAEAHRLEVERAAAEALRRQEDENEAERARNVRQQEDDVERIRQEDKAKVDAFLKEHGYIAVNAKRTKMMRTKHSLHTAVKCKNAEMCKLLLAAGADPALKNSAGQTAQQLALKSNAKGSHASCLAAFSK